MKISRREPAAVKKGVMRNLWLSCALLGALAACSTATGPQHRVFASADEGANALIQAVKGGKLDEVLAIFGPDGQALVDSSDPVAARRNQQIFNAAAAERWRLEDQGSSRKTLVVGN